MKKVLYRGKRVDNGEWVEGGITFDMSGAPYICPTRFSDYDEEIEVIPETVGQWIGITDKNGKNIFEGHIVKAKSTATGKEEQYIVCFDDTSIWFGFKSRYSGYVYSLDGLLQEQLGDEINFEIVGNVHDTEAAANPCVSCDTIKVQCENCSKQIPKPPTHGSNARPPKKVLEIGIHVDALKAVIRKEVAAEILGGLLEHTNMEIRDSYDKSVKGSKHYGGVNNAYHTIKRILESYAEKYGVEVK